MRSPECLHARRRERNGAADPVNDRCATVPCRHDIKSAMGLPLAPTYTSEYRASAKTAFETVLGNVIERG